MNIKGEKMYFYDFPIIRNESELPIYLTSIGQHECQPHLIRSEGYAYPQILYCTKGSGTLKLGEKLILIPPMTAIFLPARLPHEYYPNEDVWDIHWVAPSGFAADRILSQFGLTEAAVFHLSGSGLLEHFFRRMHESIMGDSIFGNFRASGYLYDFLIEFYRIISGKASDTSQNSTITKAVDYINSNYTSDITLDELCSTVCVSRQHLCRLFRSVLGSRPMEYIAKRRIQAAKELLSHSSLSIEEIAEQTGFCSGSYFCKLFRRYEGITPTQFRRS